MSNELQNTLNEILQDKNTNLKPENLKAGVTCLGIQGNLSEGNGKIYPNKDSLLNDSLYHEGLEYGVAYGEPMYNPTTSNQIVNTVIFPQSITLGDTVTDTVYGKFICDDGTGTSEQWNYDIVLTPTQYTASRRDGTLVEYTSEDGLTYNRITEFENDEYTFDLVNGWSTQYDSEVLGSFCMLIIPKFEGLYNLIDDTFYTIIGQKCPTYTKISDGNYIINHDYYKNITFTSELIVNLKDYLDANFPDIHGEDVAVVSTDRDNIYDLYLVCSDTDVLQTSGVIYYNNEAYLGYSVSYNVNGVYVKKVQVDFSTNTILNHSDVEIINQGTNWLIYHKLTSSEHFGLPSVYFSGVSGLGGKLMGNTYTCTIYEVTDSIISTIGKIKTPHGVVWALAQTQLSSDLAKNLAAGYIVYGNNGIEEGTLSVSNILEMEADYINLDEENKLLYFSASNGSKIILNDFTSNLRKPYTDVANAIGLTSDKIVSGNTILGVDGSAVTGGIDTSDATATINDIVKGKTAYVNGEKITGVLETSGIQPSDYFNLQPNDGETLIKAYPDTIDCSNLTYFSFYNDFNGVYVPNLINTNNINSFSSIASTGTLGFMQEEIDVSSCSMFTYAFSGFYNITSTPKLANLFKNGVGSVEFSQMYATCSKLETIPEFTLACDPSTLNGLSANVDSMISGCSALTEQSITNVLNLLKLLNDNSMVFNVHTLSEVGLSYKQLNDLTEDQLAILASMEGWTTGLELYTTEIEIGDLQASVGGKTIPLNMTLLDYLTGLSSRPTITKWISDISVDYNSYDVSEFASPEELVAFLNSIKLKATSDTITINIQLSVEDTTGQRFGLTNYYDNIISANVKSTVTLLMTNVPIKLNVDTQGKDLNGFKMIIRQFDSGSISSYDIHDFMNSSLETPIGTDMIYTQLYDTPEYNFNMELCTAKGITTFVTYNCKDFSEDNLTFTFTIYGQVLTNKSPDNTTMSNVMTLFSEDKDHFALYYNAEDVITDENLKLYNGDTIVSYAFETMSSEVPDFCRLTAILMVGEAKPSDINGYSYGSYDSELLPDA